MEQEYGWEIEADEQANLGVEFEMQVAHAEAMQAFVGQSHSIG